MASRIKGITIEIDGNTTKLEKSLSGVNSTIRQSKTELRDVQKLLKIDPTNTTLLKQKFDALKTSISANETKLKSLKEAQKQMDAKGVSKSSEEYKALEREIVATEQEMKRLKDTVGSGSYKLAEFGAKADNASQKLGGIGKALMPVTAVITAFGTASVKAFEEVDAGADNVIKKTGAVGEEAKKLQTAYKGLGKNVNSEWSDIGNAVGEVSTRFHLTGKELQKTTQDFIRFSEINNTDVVSSVDNVQKVLTAFNMDTKESSKMLDVLNKVGQDTGVDMQTLTTQLYQNSTALQDMGLNAYSGAQFLGQLEVSGAESSTVLMGLKKALVQSAKEGKTLDQALAEMQDYFKGSTSEQEKLTKATELFGTRSAPALLSAIKSGSLDFRNLSDSTKLVEKSMGGVNKTWKATDDGTKKIKRQIKDLKSSFGEFGGEIAQTASPMVKKFGDDIKGLGKWFKSLDKDQKQSVVKLTAFIALLSPGTIALSKMVGAVGTLANAFSKLKNIEKVQGLIKGLTSPVGMVVTALGAMTVGAIKANEKLNEMMKAGESTEGFNKLVKDTAKLDEQISKTTKKFGEIKEAREQALAGTEKAQQLFDQLTSLADASGKVNDADKQRAQYILGELNSALGTEYTMTGNQIQNYQTLQQEVAKTIKVKQAEAVLSANQKAYAQAIKNKIELETNYSKALIKQNKLENERIHHLKLYQESNNPYLRKQALADLEKNTEAQKENNQAIKDAQSTIKDYNATIQTQESLQSALASGSFEQLSQALDKVKNNLISFDGTNKQVLEDQKNKTIEDLQAITEAHRKHGELITQDSVNSVAESVALSFAELDKAGALTASAVTKMNAEMINALVSANLSGKMGAEAQGGVQALISTFANGTPAVQAQGEKLFRDAMGAKVNKQVDGYSKANGTTYLKSLSTLISKGDISPDVLKNFNKSDAKTKKKGKEHASNYGKGIEGEKSAVGNKAKALGDHAKSKLTTSTSGKGKDFAQGYINGMNGMAWDVYNTAFNLGVRATRGLADGQKSSSPSKVTKSMGGDFGDGYIIGIKSKEKQSVDTAKRLALETTSALSVPMKLGNMSIGQQTVNNLQQLTQAMGKQNFNITVVSELDGKIVSKNTAQYMKKDIANLEQFDMIRKGIK